MLLCNVGVLKTMQCTAVWQHRLVAGWLGPSVTVRVKVRSRAREWCFSLLFLFFSSLLFFTSLLYFSSLLFFSKSDILVYGACV